MDEVFATHKDGLELPDNARTSIHVGPIVENGIPQQDDMFHGLKNIDFDTFIPLSDNSAMMYLNAPETFADQPNASVDTFNTP